MRQSNVDTKKNEQKLSRPPKIDKLYGFNNINMLIWNHTSPYAYLEPYPPPPEWKQTKRFASGNGVHSFKTQYST